ncbi:hypothetical protein PLICRDRAFT_35250 [Plicaturopsis crispa FD-325 SS-3]|nr:hypothetical protein PLICRDRAFT_35250 [Plicaturopsis crispa FD-325 SS-3]
MATEEELEVILALSNTRYITLASWAMLVYEYIITVDEEAKYYWTGPMTISRFLFLLNRYLPLVLATCEFLTRVGFAFTLLSSAIIQAILVVRIWYLFSRQKAIRVFAVGSFVVSNIATVAILGMAYHTSTTISVDHLRAVFPGVAVTCIPPESEYLGWRWLLPALIEHTVLYLLTLYWSFKDDNKNPFLKRIRRDGGLFYLVVFVSMGFREISSVVGDLAVEIPAFYSSLPTAITSISIARVMLSIRSFAADMSAEADFVLNEAELSRLTWQRGTCDGEIHVQIEQHDGPDEIRLARMTSSRTIQEDVPATLDAEVSFMDFIATPRPRKS